MEIDALILDMYKKVSMIVESKSFIDISRKKQNKKYDIGGVIINPYIEEDDMKTKNIHINLLNHLTIRNSWRDVFDREVIHYKTDLQIMYFAIVCLHWCALSKATGDQSQNIKNVHFKSLFLEMVRVSLYRIARENLIGVEPILPNLVSFGMTPSCQASKIFIEEVEREIITPLCMRGSFPLAEKLSLFEALEFFN